MRIFLSFIFYVFANSLYAFEPQVPSFQPDFWNEDSSTLWNNNCYNYSTNRVTDSFAQPGEASGEFFDLTCESILKAASADLGLVKTKAFPFSSKSQETLIALVVAPDYDFHWYRRDDSNLWSHKPGATQATDRDESDNIITSPETADRGLYADFCGYFKVKSNIVGTSEQNMGYVRIGDMMDLPQDEIKLTESKATPSEVEILLYSGRRNPRLPLNTLLRSRSLSLLQEIAQYVRRRDLPQQKQIPTKLGYNGILIRDIQGVLFDKDTAVHLKGDVVVLHKAGQRSSVGLTVSAAKELEQIVLSMAHIAN